MCKGCAPVAEEEETSIRAIHVTTQVGNDVNIEEEARIIAKTKAVGAGCPKCGASTMGHNFCPG